TDTAQLCADPGLPRIAAPDGGSRGDPGAVSRKGGDPQHGDLAVSGERAHDVADRDVLQVPGPVRECEVAALGAVGSAGTGPQREIPYAPAVAGQLRERRWGGLPDIPVDLALGGNRRPLVEPHPRVGEGDIARPDQVIHRWRRRELATLTAWRRPAVRAGTGSRRGTALEPVGRRYALATGGLHGRAMIRAR